MRIRTIRRTLIPQHIEQFSRTGGWVNFQYLPGIKFMRASTEPLLCLSTNSTVREKNHCTNFHSFYPLPVIHLQVFLPFLWENQRGGKKKKRSLLWTANRILFSRGARVFAYRVQILDGCSDRFSQRRKYTRASLLPERGNVSGIRRTLVGTARLSQDRHYFVWRTRLSREYSRG